MEDQMNNSNQNSAVGGNSILDKASALLGNVNVGDLQNSLKQYGTTATNSVKSMSTTQKVLGGALIAAGAWYLTKRSKPTYKANAAHASRHDL